MAGVIAIHPTLWFVQDPGLPLVVVEPGVVAVLNHLEVSVVHVLRREVGDLERHQLLVAQSPLAHLSSKLYNFLFLFLIDAELK